MNEDRGWMYSGRKSKNEITSEWVEKTTEFLDQAFARNTGHFGVMCPCSQCYNRRPQNRSKMIEHLVKNGFRPGYTVWVHHGERGQSRSDVIRQRTDDGGGGGGYNENRIPEMVDDVHHAFEIPLEEEPEPSTQAFFDMLTASNRPLHSHTKVSQLDAITRLLAVKAQFSTSIACFDAFLAVIATLLPDGHNLPPNMYESKKLLSALKMPYKMIHVCPKQCMLFRNEHADDKYCVKCGSSRYIEVDSGNGSQKQLTVPMKVLRYLPFLPRLQRLYMFEGSAKQMIWHKHGHRYHPEKRGRLLIWSM
jgi:hypothetical protein